MDTFREIPNNYTLYYVMAVLFAIAMGWMMLTGSRIARFMFILMVEYWWASIIIVLLIIFFKTRK